MDKVLMSKGRKEKRTALDKVWQAVEGEFGHFSTEELTTRLKSPEANVRLSVILLMRKQIAEGDLPEAYFELARAVVSDPDNNCRWQSLIVICESIETQPELVWEVVSEYGNSEDSDMRAAIRCILLEHLLDHDFDTYFPKVRNEIRGGRYRFIDTLEGCWFDRMGLNYKKVQSFVKNAKRGLKKEQWTT
ncbi:MAG: hypothetical protein ACYSTF_00750 [Planctomycetota bacterium]